jgi:hypothetical protein
MKPYIHIIMVFCIVHIEKLISILYKYNKYFSMYMKYVILFLKYMKICQFSLSNILPVDET